MQLVSTRQYGIGTITRVRDISPESTKTTINKVWNEMSDEEKEADVYRSNISHIRERMLVRALSKQYMWHVVFTTDDPVLRRDIVAFRNKVLLELEMQGIDYCIYPELYHKEQIWCYADPMDKEYKEDGYTCYPADSVENAYSCYNRRAFAPLSTENGFHLHIMTDKPVDFLHYINTVPCNPDDLYCELFEDLEKFLYIKDGDIDKGKILQDFEDAKLKAQRKNHAYMSKLLYYTKAKLPENYRFLRTNNKKVKLLKETAVVDEYGEILDLIDNGFINSDDYIQRAIDKAKLANIEDFKLNPEYQSLNDYDKYKFEISYIKNLIDLNIFYKNRVRDYIDSINSGIFNAKIDSIYNDIQNKVYKRKKKIERLAKIKENNAIREAKKAKKAYWEQNNIIDFAKNTNSYFLYHSYCLIFKKNDDFLLNADIFNETISNLNILKEKSLELSNTKCLNILNYKYFDLNFLNLNDLFEFFNIKSNKNSNSNKNVELEIEKIDLDNVFEYNFWDLIKQKALKDKDISNNNPNNNDINNNNSNKDKYTKIFISDFEKLLRIYKIQFRKYRKYKFRKKLRRTIRKRTLTICNSTYSNNEITVYSLVWIPSVPFGIIPFLPVCLYVSFDTKSVTYEYRACLQSVKIYALKVKNRLSCKRFRRKRRRLQVKKPSKTKFN